MPKQINTIDSLIQTFGGPTKLASMLGITQGAVSKWTMEGEIPRGWHLILDRMAKARGFTVSDSVWGLDGFDPLAAVPIPTAESPVQV